MSRRILVALLATGLLTTPLLGLRATAAAVPTVTKIPLTFTVTVAPEGLLGTTTCTVVADLYVPSTASSTQRVPAILATNGFGGSKDDQAPIGTGFGARGYAVLSYSGLGIVDGLIYAGADPTRNVGCPNFDEPVCAAKAQLDLQGYPNATTIAYVRHKSVTSYLNQINIPTLLAQGQGTRCSTCRSRSRPTRRCAHGASR